MLVGEALLVVGEALVALAELDELDEPEHAARPETARTEAAATAPTFTELFTWSSSLGSRQNGLIMSGSVLRLHVLTDFRRTAQSPQGTNRNITTISTPETR